MTLPIVWLFTAYVSKYRIEIDRDNQSGLAKSAKANGRTKVRELNHILREHFALPESSRNEPMSQEEIDKAFSGAAPAKRAKP